MIEIKGKVSKTNFTGKLVAIAWININNVLYYIYIRLNISDFDTRYLHKAHCTGRRRDEMVAFTGFSHLSFIIPFLISVKSLGNYHLF